MARLSTSYGPLTMIALVLILLDLGAFFVLLGGASAIQKKALPITTLVNSTPGLSYLDIKPQSTPANIISYEWAKAVFQVVLLLGALGALAAGQFYRARLALVGLLAVACSLWWESTQTLYYLHGQVDAAEAVTGQYIARAVRAYYAGCIMSAALNGLLIIVLGISQETAPVADTYPTHTATANGKGMSNPAYNENTAANTV